ncbi:MAG: MBL fold metallo-hydrolase [Anaerolineales bacterium]|jgi:glyoxylase-like metal-dependent hydrolase (beta-lactamase superfamily II)
MLELRMLTVGPYEMNCYLVLHDETNQGILIDPGDEAEKILDWIASTQIDRIVLTHGHRDHIGALEAVSGALHAPISLHAADAKHFELKSDDLLEDGDMLALGKHGLRVVHVPGHTPGSVAFRLMDSHSPPRAVVGDAIFPGGPGHTANPQDLSLSLDSLARTVFTWPDETILLPGHGGSTTVGAERAAFEAFRSHPLPTDLCGDVTWR